MKLLICIGSISCSSKCLGCGTTKQRVLCSSISVGNARKRGTEQVGLKWKMPLPTLFHSCWISSTMVEEDDPELTASSAAALHSLSEYLDMPNLRITMAEFCRQNLTMSTLVDFISYAKEHCAEMLLEMAVEKFVQRLLEIEPLVACQLGPNLLLQILKKNHKSQRAGKCVCCEGDSPVVFVASCSEICSTSTVCIQRCYNFHAGFWNRWYNI
jgi:hypothetical protein